MKRLLFLVLVAIAAWYGWHHYGDLLTRRPGHQAIVENHSGRKMERVRLTVGGQTFVKESLPDESSVTFTFRVSEDATFALDWKWSDQDVEQHWAGGLVPRGPMVQRHHLNVDSEGAIIYHAENRLLE